MLLRRTFVGLGGAALAASFVSTAAPPAKTKPAAPARAPQTYSIGMKGMKFAPIPADLHVGDAIEWVNDDIFVHTATAQDKSFDVVLNPGAKARTVVGKAGSTPFACRYHDGMKGVLAVAP